MEGQFKKEKVDVMYNEVMKEERRNRERREKLEERVYKLANVRHLIQPPKFFRRCLDCGKKLSVKKWEDGGYPDYGHAYRYYYCDCGYEYGEYWSGADIAFVLLVFVLVIALIALSVLYIR